jgi:hypothetical protein
MQDTTQSNATSSVSHDTSIMQGNSQIVVKMIHTVEIP